MGNKYVNQLIINKSQEKEKYFIKYIKVKHPDNSAHLQWILDKANQFKDVTIIFMNHKKSKHIILG